MNSPQQSDTSIDERIRQRARSLQMDPARTAKVMEDAWDRTAMHSRVVLTPQLRRARWRPAKVAVALAATLVAVGGVAVAAERIVDLMHDTSSEVDGLRDSTASSISDPEAKRLETLVAGVPENSTVDLGPALADMPPLSEGRVLLDDPSAGRIAAIASKRGDVCLTYELGESIAASNCIQELDPKTGIQFMAGLNGDDRFIAGLAANDVSRITVVFEDGGTQNAVLDRNAFAWHAAKAPTELRITRGASSHTMPVSIR